MMLSRHSKILKRDMRFYYGMAITDKSAHRCFAATRPNVTNATSRSEDSNVTQDSNNISKCFQPTTNARHCCAAHVRVKQVLAFVKTSSSEIHYGGFIKKTQFTILSVRARTRSLLRNLNYIVHLSRIQQKRRVETKGAMETCAREVAKRRSGRGIYLH